VLFAQVTESKSKWAFGALGSGAASYRFTSADASSSWLKDEIDSSETWSSGYSYGISADYILSEKLSLRSGLSFSKCGQAYNDLTNYQSFRVAYQFFELPVILRYALPLEKANLVFGAGPEMTFLLRSRALYQGIGDVSINKTNINDASLQKLGLALGTQISYDRSLGINSHLELGLQYRQQVLSIAEGAIHRLPFSLGIFLGFRQTF
jgi:hypothetical protein